MKRMFRARGAPFFAAALAAVLALAASQPATAQSVKFQGIVDGCFGTGCTVDGDGSGDILGGLTFLGGNFEVDAPWDPFVGAYVGDDGENVGKFALSTDPYTYSGQEFTLWYSFTLPSSNNSVFEASLRGTVDLQGDGSVRITYQDPRIDTWYDGDWAYSVEVHNFTSVQAGDTGYIDATFTAVVPEPITVGLLATGLLGIGGFASRRRRKATEADLI